MGRKPKITTTKESSKPQNTLSCSVCGKEFKISGDTKHIINGGYTCSWKCFYNEARRQDAERAERRADKGSRRSKK